MNVSCSEDFIRQISFSFGLFELISSNPKLSCWHVAWSSYPFGLSSVGESTTSEAAKNFKRADPPAYVRGVFRISEIRPARGKQNQERVMAGAMSRRHDHKYLLFTPWMAAEI